ncbi:MAG TPA: CsbD family protein [Thermoanaerobaculia bacterium]|nr:CsbD family protein [Thermoanaerobaculia bacterium]
MTHRSHRTDAEESAVNKTAGKLNQIKGNIKEAWGDVTDNPAREHEGKRDRIKGRVQEEYGELKEKESRLERDLDDLDRDKV